MLRAKANTLCSLVQTSLSIVNILSRHNSRGAGATSVRIGTPHVQAWLSWSEQGTVNPYVVGSIPSKTRELKFPWI